MYRPKAIHQIQAATLNVVFYLLFSPFFRYCWRKETLVLSKKRQQKIHRKRKHTHKPRDSPAMIVRMWICLHYVLESSFWGFVSSFKNFRYYPTACGYDSFACHLLLLFFYFFRLNFGAKQSGVLLVLLALSRPCFICVGHSTPLLLLDNLLKIYDNKQHLVIVFIGVIGNGNNSHSVFHSLSLPLSLLLFFFCYSLFQRETLKSDSINSVNGAVNNISDGGRMNLTNKSYVIWKR